MSQSQDLTELLQAWNGGDESARDKLVPLVYDELRRLAGHYMQRERAGHTPQATALVNEAFLRLFAGDLSLQNRSHFFGIAARLMRQVLIDHARGKNYLKRAGGKQTISLSAAADVEEFCVPEILRLDDALNHLEELDPQKARIVELRFFTGLTIDETAKCLHISHATVEREWKAARAWLKREMTRL